MPLSQIELLCNELATRIRRRDVRGSFKTGIATAELLRSAVNTKWSVSQSLLSDLISLVKKFGKQLIASNPSELAIGNVVRRVLYIIREEFKELVKVHRQEEVLKRSMSLSLMYDDEQEVDLNEEMPEQVAKEIKGAIQGGIQELIDELNNSYKNISDQGLDHIHGNEIIMTMGSSNTMQHFLTHAARRRQFSVFVVEGAPSRSGQQMTAALAAANVDVTLVPDTDVFALMSRVNKVIISTHAVMANGGLIANTGAHVLALAAKHHSVPVLVCTGLYKLCPLFPTDSDSVNVMNSPSTVLPFEEAEALEHVHVENPAFDYVPPDLVTIYITNFGGYNPSYVYRLLSEFYSAEDMDL